MGCIYKLENKINGKCYYGYTTETFQRRINGHIARLNVGKHHCKGIQEDFDSSGREVFKFDIIAESDDIKQLRKWEKKLIEIFTLIDKGLLYNIKDENSMEISKNILKGLICRPSQSSKDPFERKLSCKLSNYTSQKSPRYDPLFDKEIRASKPSWFEDKVAIKKEILKTLDKRPNWYSDDPQEKELANALGTYTSKTRRGPGTSFDPVFNEEIRRLKPKWFFKEHK